MAFNFPASPTNDQIYVSSGRTLTWNSIFKWPGGAATIEVQVLKEEVVKPDYPDYYALRRNEYPKIGDQLDALWKGVDSPEFANVMNKIQEVKQKYPKK